MAYTVGEVARLANVSVRTLHHYDEIGLLEPSQRSDAGYRLYTDDDLVRLQQVLLYRELDFTLDEIGQVLCDQDFDPLDALVAQRQLVADKLKRDEGLLALLDKTILAMEGGIQLDKEEMFEIFGDFDPAEHEEEAKERWGETDSYKESSRRTARYTKADWQRFKDEQEAVGARMVALFDEGVEPTDSRSMDVADEARLQIDKWFYPLSREQHVCLGEMYVADPRFKANYEKQREGLAQWLCDAIKANAERD